MKQRTWLSGSCSIGSGRRLLEKGGNHLFYSMIREEKRELIATEHRKKKEQNTLRPYHKPHLCAYGIVRELTTGGTGTKTENKAMQSNRRP